MKIRENISNYNGYKLNIKNNNKRQKKKMKWKCDFSNNAQTKIEIQLLAKNKNINQWKKIYIQNRKEL